MSKLALVNGVIMRLKEVEEVSVAEVEKLLTDAKAEVTHLESLLSQVQGGAQPAAPAEQSVEQAAPAAPAADPATPADQTVPTAPTAPEQPTAPAADPNAAPAAPADPNVAPILM